MSNTDSSLPPGGPTITRALNLLVATLDARSIRYAIIGGIAAIQYARVRATDDIDVLLTVPQIAMPAMFEALKSGGFTVDVATNMLELRDGGITTIRFADVLVDIMRPLLPVYSHVLDRAVPTEILGQTVRVGSAEGLIILKLIAFRPQDQSDIKELLAAYHGRLDLDFIRREFSTVAEPNDPRWATFEEWSA